MYEAQIKRVGELVYGEPRMNMGLAITKVSEESGVPAFTIAQALRRRRTAKDCAEAAREHRRTTVPNWMIQHMVER